MATCRSGDTGAAQHLIPCGVAPVSRDGNGPCERQELGCSSKDSVFALDPKHNVIALCEAKGVADGLGFRAISTPPRNGLQWRMTVATSPRGSTVGVRELKNQLSSFLDRVKAGEEITVTEHGRPIARLSAVGGDVDRMALLVAAGIVQPSTSPHRQLPKKRVKLTDGSSSLADVVAEQRG